MKQQNKDAKRGKNKLPKQKVKTAAPSPKQPNELVIYFEKTDLENDILSSIAEKHQLYSADIIEGQQNITGGISGQQNLLDLTNSHPEKVIVFVSTLTQETISAIESLSFTSKDSIQVPVYKGNSLTENIKSSWHSLWNSEGALWSSLGVVAGYGQVIGEFITADCTPVVSGIIENARKKLKHIEYPKVDTALAGISPVKEYFQKNKTRYIDSPLKEIKQGIDWKDGNSGIYRLGYFSLSALILLLMPILSFSFGITWDEWTLIDYADDILDFYLSFGEDKSVFDMKIHARNSHIHYGAFFDTIAAAVYRFISPFGIYETRHLINSLFGAWAIIITARIGKELGNWRLAMIAFLLILLSPRFFGHSMNNPKDIPFLTGYGMGIYYLIRFFRQLPAPSVGAFFWAISAIALTISMKIAGLILVGYFGLWGGLIWLYQFKSQGTKPALKLIKPYFEYMIIVVVLGYLLGILFWPWGISSPIKNPYNSFTEFANFRFLVSYELFEGKRIFMDTPPSHYVFKWIGISVPVIAILGFIIGLFAPIKKYIQEKQHFVWLALVFSFFFPIITTIVQNSTLYSGWRHLMFVYVPFIVIAAGGIEFFISLGKKVITYITLGLLVIGLAKPTYWMIKNNPHAYMYFNELTGGINGAYTNYETEYWGNAMKPAAEWLMQHDPSVFEKKTKVGSNIEVRTAGYYFKNADSKVGMVWTRENEKYKKDWDYAFFASRTMSKEYIQNSFPPKGTIHVIKADTVPLIAIVKREHKYIHEGHTLRSQRKYKEALELAQKAVDYDPNNTEALHLLASCQIALSMHDQAIKTLKKTAKVNPEDFAAYTLIGISYNTQKQYKKAIPYLLKSVKIKINNSSGYHNLGRAYTQLKDFQKALQNYEKAIHYDNGKSVSMLFDASVCLINRGMTYPQLKESSLRAAINNLQQVVQRSPKLIQAYQNIAYAYKQLGDENSANQWMQRASQVR